MTDIYRYKEGYYATNGNKKQLTHCREIFHKRQKRSKHFLFIHPSLYAITTFVHAIEDRLNVEHSLIESTDDWELLYIYPSEFWRCNKMRYSLFSLILRASLQFYPGQDVFETLFREKYLEQTRPALVRFLDGYTRYTGWTNRDSWLKAFHDKEANKLLKLPYFCFLGIKIDLI